MSSGAGATREAASARATASDLRSAGACPGVKCPLAVPHRRGEERRYGGNRDELLEERKTRSAERSSKCSRSPIARDTSQVCTSASTTRKASRSRAGSGIASGSPCRDLQASDRCVQGGDPAVHARGDHPTSRHPGRRRSTRCSPRRVVREPVLVADDVVDDLPHGPVAAWCRSRPIGRREPFRACARTRRGRPERLDRGIGHDLIVPARSLARSALDPRPLDISARTLGPRPGHSQVLHSAHPEADEAYRVVPGQAGNA